MLQQHVSVLLTRTKKKTVNYFGKKLYQQYKTLGYLQQYFTAIYSSIYTSFMGLCTPLGVSHVITSQGPHGNEVAKVRSGLWTPPLLCLCTRTKEFSCIYVSADWCNELHASSSCSRCHDVEVDVAGWGRGPGCEVIINHPLVCTHCLHSLSGGILNRGINYQHRLPYHRVQWLFCLPAQTSL